MSETVIETVTVIATETETETEIVIVIVKEIVIVIVTVTVIVIVIVIHVNLEERKMDLRRLVCRTLRAVDMCRKRSWKNWIMTRTEWTKRT